MKLGDVSLSGIGATGLALHLQWFLELKWQHLLLTYVGVNWASMNATIKQSVLNVSKSWWKQRWTVWFSFNVNVGAQRNCWQPEIHVFIPKMHTRLTREWFIIITDCRVLSFYIRWCVLLCLSRKKWTLDQNRLKNTAQNLFTRKHF